MPRRRIGQETFGFESQDRTTALDELHGLIDWDLIEAALEAIPVAERGEAGWPPLALFKALLIAVWNDLSDVKLAEALDDRFPSGAFAASRGSSRRPSEPPSCGSAACSWRWASTGRSSSASTSSFAPGR